MIRVTLRYGEAWVEDNPSWHAISSFFAARFRALSDLEHSSDLVTETLRLFIARWRLTDANGVELVFPDGIEAMYFEDALTVSEAITRLLVERKIIVESEGGEPRATPANPTPPPLSD